MARPRAVRPENRIPVPTDRFCDSWNTDVVTGGQRWLTITKVEHEIKDGPYVGRAIVADDGQGYDCFWSDRHQRFQYHPDHRE